MTTDIRAALIAALNAAQTVAEVDEIGEMVRMRRKHLGFQNALTLQVGQKVELVRNGSVSGVGTIVKMNRAKAIVAIDSSGSLSHDRYSVPFSMLRAI